MAETTYRYRGKDLTYDQFIDGPGKNMSTAELEAALDKASGATKNRRSLLITMGRNGYKKTEKPGDRTLYFQNGDEEVSFSTYGEVEQFLLDKGLIRDEKAEAAEKAAAKKEREKARKEAAAQKEKEKKAADRAKAREKAAAKKKADKKKEAERKAAEKAKAAAKKEAQKKKEAEKKATGKAKAAKAKATKASAPKKSATKTTTATKKPGRPAKATEEKVAAKAGRRPGRPKKEEAVKAAGEAKTPARKVGRPAGKKETAPATKGTGRGKGRGIATAPMKMPKGEGLVIQIGRKRYTEERLKGLALDSYRYDMGKDPKGAKVELYVKAEEKKCVFVVNGKDRGEIGL